MISQYLHADAFASSMRSVCTNSAVSQLELVTSHYSLFTSFSRAVSSVVEHLVYTERVGGSKPSPPIFDFRVSICD